MTFTLVILVAGGLLLVTSRTAIALGAYVVLAAAASTLIVPAATGSALALAVFSVTTVMKVLIAPLVMLWFLRAQPAARTLRPSLSVALRLLLAIGFAVVGIGTPLGLGLFILVCGVGMLVVHRNLMAHLIGLLALGTGVTLCGAVLAPGLPESVELGGTFDALVGTFIGLGLIRAFAAHDPLLDVESLKRLRG